MAIAIKTLAIDKDLAPLGKKTTGDFYVGAMVAMGGKEAASEITAGGFTLKLASALESNQAALVRFNRCKDAVSVEPNARIVKGTPSIIIAQKILYQPVGILCKAHDIPLIKNTIAQVFNLQYPAPDETLFVSNFDVKKAVDQIAETYVAKHSVKLHADNRKPIENMPVGSQSFLSKSCNEVMSIQKLDDAMKALANGTAKPILDGEILNILRLPLGYHLSWKDKPNEMQVVPLGIEKAVDKAKDWLSENKDKLKIQIDAVNSQLGLLLAGKIERAEFLSTDKESSYNVHITPTGVGVAKKDLKADSKLFDSILGAISQMEQASKGTALTSGYINSLKGKPAEPFTVKIGEVERSVYLKYNEKGDMLGIYLPTESGGFSQPYAILSDPASGAQIISKHELDKPYIGLVVCQNGEYSTVPITVASSLFG